jgi:hypothetical protein
MRAKGGTALAQTVTMPTPSKRSLEVKEPFDAGCLDFVAYVARQHGLARGEAESVAKCWLRHYEPTAEARRAFERHGPRSGVYHALPSDDEQLTGTSG